MRLTRKYDIDKIHISSTKYVTNHIQQYLQEHNFAVKAIEDQLKFRYKDYLLRGIGFVEGNIHVYIRNNDLCIQLRYTNFDLILMMLPAVCFIILKILNLKQLADHLNIIGLICALLVG